MENQDNKNELQLNDLSALYKAIFFIFMTNKGECFNFCWTEILKGMYLNNSVELTMVNKDDPKKPADCQLMRTATICLSEDKRAILITQNLQNNETEQIFMHLDGKKIMVSKNVLQTRDIISDKGFIFNEKKFTTLPKYYEETINGKDNQNKNGSSNNNNIYKEKRNELENDLKNEISVEEDNQNMRLPKKSKQKRKKVNFNDEIDIINVESFKKLNHDLVNNDDNDEEEKNDINSDNIGSSDSYDASNMNENNKTQEKPNSNNENNKMNNLNSNNEANNIVDNFSNIELKNNNNNVIGDENSQKHPNGNITENNNKDANKEKLVKDKLNKIYPEDNGKKTELQLEGQEAKTKNGCNCCLDCLKWCKDLC